MAEKRESSLLAWLKDVPYPKTARMSEVTSVVYMIIDGVMKYLFYDIFVTEKKHEVENYIQCTVYK